LLAAWGHIAKCLLIFKKKNVALCGDRTHEQ